MSMASSGPKWSVSTPWLIIEPPPGWILEYEEDKGVLRVVQKMMSRGQAVPPLLLPISVMLKSHYFREPVPLQKMLALTQQSFLGEGFEVGDPFEDQIDEKPACGFTATAKEQPARGHWLVQREPNFLTIIDGFVLPGAFLDAKTACAEILRRLRFTDPKEVQAN